MLIYSCDRALVWAVGSSGEYRAVLHEGFEEARPVYGATEVPTGRPVYEPGDASQGGGGAEGSGSASYSAPLPSVGRAGEESGVGRCHSRWL
jgi:hypothetical protein